MSNAAVRAAFRDHWIDYAPGIARLEVINTATPEEDLQDAIDATCGAILFQIETREDVTFGSNPWVEERGTATIRLIGPSGKGDPALAQAATAIATRLAGRILAPDVLVLEAVGPIEEEPEGDGEAYWLAVSARYVWQGREPRLQGGP